MKPEFPYMLEFSMVLAVSVGPMRPCLQHPASHQHPVMADDECQHTVHNSNLYVSITVNI